MTNTGLAKGIAIGVVAGTAIGMAVTPKSKNAKSMAGKALRTAGEIIDNISGMWR